MPKERTIAWLQMTGLLIAVRVAAEIAPAPSARPPAVIAVNRLSALPIERSVGAGGPTNRLALDITGFGPSVPESALECSYAGQVRYRCIYEIESVRSAPDSIRIDVRVPDLGKGTQVLLRFSNRAGVAQLPIELVNPPQTVHQIESIPLPDGGHTTIGSDGRPAPVLNLQTSHIQRIPALIVTTPYHPNICDQLYAQWNQVSATDAVFSSAFGPLPGSLVLSQPVIRGSPVSEQNLPQWRATYAAGATRVQFIAHYEVIFRVGICADRIIRS